jgi:hypothetical protein
MFLLIVIILLIAATSILGNIYVWFFSFQQNYWDLENYKNSYYAAISSVERWLLVTKYKEPWFIWSGWFLWTWSRWPTSDTFSWNFWKINYINNWTYRDINSRTQKISWDIEYNKIFILYKDIDNSTDNYNTTDSSNLNNFYENEENYISWYIYKNNKFSNIIDSNLKWITRISNTEHWWPMWSNIINSSNINNKNPIYFTKSTNNIHTINPNNTASTSGQPWSWFYTIIGNALWNQELEQFTWTNAFYWMITPSNWILFYITWDIKDGNNNRLPNLKYYFQSNTWFADINYNITWSAIIWNYKKDIFIQKPTSNIRNPNRKKFIFPYYN